MTPAEIHIVIAHETGYEPQSWLVAAYGAKNEAEKHAQLAQNEAAICHEKNREIIDAWDFENGNAPTIPNAFDPEAHEHRDATYGVISLPLRSNGPPRLVGAALVRHIVQRCCAEFGVTPGEIEARDRRPHIARARQIAMFLVRRLTDRSYPQIGGDFRRDFSTVIYAQQAIERARTDPAFAEMIDRLEAELREGVAQ